MNGSSVYKEPNPFRIPYTFQPLFTAASVAARIAAFSPGASPPPVLIAIFIIYWSFVIRCSLLGGKSIGFTIILQIIILVSPVSVVQVSRLSPWMSCRTPAEGILLGDAASRASSEL
jgi:hypothetical protein